MPQRLRLWLRSLHKRHENVEDRGCSKDQEQLRPTLLPESPSTQQIHAATSTSALRLPAAPATNSADIEAPTGADGTTASLPIQLWDRAYDDLKREEPKLVDAYEKILSRQLQDGPGSIVPESQPNTIAQDDSDRRRRQMTQLINASLVKTEREAKEKVGLDVAVDVLSARSAIQAEPQAALAWTGICIVLEVRSFGGRYFVY